MVASAKSPPTTNYVGIAGARNDPANRLSAAGGAGVVSGGGVLFPNSKIRFADITDGTTNQILVGEQGDWLFQTGGTRVDWRASLPHSAFMGFDQAGTPANGNMNNDNRAFNTTTVRYVLNDKKNAGAGNAGWSGNCSTDAVCFNEGNSNPLNSAHTGGVQFIFGDGSVKFLRDSIPIATLQMLATRDDGAVLPSLD